MKITELRPPEYDKIGFTGHIIPRPVTSRLVVEKVKDKVKVYCDIETFLCG